VSGISTGYSAYLSSPLQTIFTLHNQLNSYKTLHIFTSDPQLEKALHSPLHTHQPIKMSSAPAKDTAVSTSIILPTGMTCDTCVSDSAVASADPDTGGSYIALWVVDRDGTHFFDPLMRDASGTSPPSRICSTHREKDLTQLQSDVADREWDEELADLSQSRLTAIENGYTGPVYALA
jgi:hypothetical protein